MCLGNCVDMQMPGEEKVRLRVAKFTVRSGYTVQRLAKNKPICVVR